MLKIFKKIFKKEVKTPQKKKPNYNKNYNTNYKSVSYEYSCGGVVIDGKKVLLIQIVNLAGRKVWTFPKGHLEKGETARETAIREVEEETGYRASIIRPIYKNKYSFTVDGVNIRKTVQWYLMRLGAKFDKLDKTEIIDTKWISIHNARKIVRYPTDQKLLDKTQEYFDYKERQGRSPSLPSA